MQWSGGQTQAAALAEHLARRGHEVTFICQPGSELSRRLPPRGLAVRTVRMRHSLDLRSVLAMRRLFRELRPEVAHLHSAISHTLGGLAARLAGVPVVVAHKRTDFVPRRGRLTRWRYERLVDRMIVISNGVREATLRAGIDPERLEMIHSSVDCDFFHPGISGQPLRTELGIGAAEPVLGLVGQLVRRKGHHLVLAAAPDILAAYPAARFLLCGEGPEEDALRRQAADLSLGDRVVFLGFREDAREVTAALDIVLMPSLLEGLGVAVLEALAMEKPVVASAVGGLPESVIHEQTGLLVPPGEVEPLTAAVLRLLGDPELRGRLGRAGRQHALAHFSRPVMVDRTEALYRRLLEERRAREGGWRS